MIADYFPIKMRRKVVSINFVTLIQSQSTALEGKSCSSPISFLVYFTVQIDYRFYAVQKQSLCKHGHPQYQYNGQLNT